MRLVETCQVASNQGGQKARNGITREHPLDAEFSAQMSHVL